MVCLNSLLLNILSHYVTLKDSLPWFQTVLSMTIISYKFFCCGWGKMFSKQCFQGVFKKSCCASFKNFDLKFRKFFRKYMVGSQFLGLFKSSSTTDVFSNTFKDRKNNFHVSPCPQDATGISFFLSHVSKRRFLIVQSSRTCQSKV